MPQSETSISTSGLDEAATSASTEAPRGELSVHFFARTDVGQIREHNEDNYLIADLTTKSRELPESPANASVGPYGAIFAVCDGMGGAAAGEIASQLAVDILYEQMSTAVDDCSSTERDELARRLVTAVEVAGLRIFQEAKADRTRRGMGTTVTAAALLDDYLFLAQVGDSRGYILRGEKLTQVTRDQSLVNQLIEAGQLTEEEAETFEHNNIILQALGTSDTVQVDLTYVRLQRGDVLLVCSDGLSGMMRLDEIREVLKASGNPSEACKRLIDRANDAGGHDNITVIVARFDGEGLVEGWDESEPLRYRKYPLPEKEPPSYSEYARGTDTPTLHPLRSHEAPSNPAPNGEAQDAETTPEAVRLGVHGPPSARAAKAPRAEGPAPPTTAAEEGIEIPGARVPGWIVASIIAAVVLVLAGTAFILLRDAPQ